MSPRKETDEPVWIKSVGAVGGAVLPGVGILAIVWQVAGYLLESDLIEVSAKCRKQCRGR